jgi:membrane protein
VKGFSLWVVTIKEIRKKLNKDSIGVYSAQSAFFIILSFFPFTMLLLTLLRYLPISFDNLTDYSVEVLSPTLTEFVQGIFDEIYEKASGAIISVTSITAIWSASKGLMSVMRGLNAAYGVRSKRGYFRLRLAAAFYTLFLAGMIIATLAMLVFGRAIAVTLFGEVPIVSGVLSVLLELRFLIGFGILVLFFMFLYKVMPERKTTLYNELPGALFCAIGWVAFSMLYSFYVDNLSDFSYLYGSLSAIVFLMLWLYFCMYILFIGAEINDLLQDDLYLKDLKFRISERRAKKKGKTQR